MSARQRTTPRLSWGLGRFIGFVLLMVTVVICGLYQVHARHQLIQVGYMLDTDRYEQRRLLETNKRLQLALSTHKDPNAVRNMATTRLGMRPARQTDEFRVPSIEDVPPAPETMGADDAR